VARRRKLGAIVDFCAFRAVTFIASLASTGVSARAGLLTSGFGVARILLAVVDLSAAYSIAIEAHSAGAGVSARTSLGTFLRSEKKGRRLKKHTEKKKSIKQK
jgi:hypothetical protein